MGWFEFFIFLPIFYQLLPFLSIAERRMFKFPTTVVDLSISHFPYIIFCLYHIIYFEALLQGACAFRAAVSFDEFIPLHYKIISLYPWK